MGTDLNKEKNFISAVVYLHNDGARAVQFFKVLTAELDVHFTQYELIAVSDACTDDTVERLRKWATNITKPLTVLHMSLYQQREVCMNAGIDAAIGDYVYEFDSTEMPYQQELIFKAYATATAGSDIVSVCPNRVRHSSKLFYRIFNANSRSIYSLRTDVFRLVSRRAINRVHAISEHLYYRKAAYAASGLKVTDLEYDGGFDDQAKGRVILAVDSLALYTDAGVKISVGIALTMMLVAVAELAYTICVFFSGNPIAGWTTTMFVLTLGFCGLFAILTIILKYLSLLMDESFKKQKYLVEGIEKIQK